jgi:hypothetical protein
MIQPKHREICKQALELLFRLSWKPNDERTPDSRIWHDPSNAVDDTSCRPSRPRASHRLQDNRIRMLQRNIHVVGNVA